MGAGYRMKKEDKTNVMRVLDQKKVNYVPHVFDPELAIAGMEVAALLNEAPERCFKTLVTIGRSGKYHVFMVPVCNELNLKAAAKAVSEKSIEMLPQKELLPLTGYIHGGCSPIGMKKLFNTVIDSSAFDYETIFFSAGKLGHQVEVNPEDIKKVIPITSAVISDKNA